MNMYYILVLPLVVASSTRAMHYDVYMRSQDKNDACIVRAIANIREEMKQKLPPADEELLALLDDDNQQQGNKRAQDQPFFWKTVSERVVWSLDPQENDLKERCNPPATFKKKSVHHMMIRSEWIPQDCWSRHGTQRFIFAVHTRDVRQQVLMCHVLCKTAKKKIAKALSD